MSPQQRALCEECWREAARRFRLEPRQNKTRHEHYREILKEMGSHDDGHPERRPTPAGTRETERGHLILEIPQDEGDEFPDYVLIRQGRYARAYKYPPGDGAGGIFLKYQEALEWIYAACSDPKLTGAKIVDGLVLREILVRTANSDDFVLSWKIPKDV